MTRKPSYPAGVNSADFAG